VTRPTLQPHAACVAFRPRDGDYEVLLVAPPRSQQWRLPAAPVEEGETPIAAALRGLAEATGIHGFSGPLLDQAESITPTGERQRCDYFLARALTAEPLHGGWEGETLAWLPVDEAITHPASAVERAVLIRARSLLRAPGSATRLLPPLLAHLLTDLPANTLAALAETELWVEEEPYVMLAVPTEARARLLRSLGKAPPLLTIEDGDEFTLVLAESAFNQVQDALSLDYQAEPDLRFIRLEATLPWETVGYGAAIFAALAAAGVSAGFYSGYSIDYLLISAGALPLATAAIELLVAEAGRRAPARGTQEHAAR